MRILIATRIHNKQKYLAQLKSEKKKYGEIKNKLVIGEAQWSWEKAFKNLGHQVKIFRYNISSLYSLKLDYIFEEYKKNNFKRIWALFDKIKTRFPNLSFDISLRNKKLLRQIDGFKPDIFIISGGSDYISVETIKKIKYEYGIKVVLTHGMSPALTATYTEKKLAPHYDLIAVNDFYHAISWKELGGNAIALPVSACDPDIHKRYELSEEEKREYGCDVCFVGSLYPESFYKERIKILEELTEFDLGVWTPNKREILKNRVLNNFYRGEAYGEKMLKIFNASKIVLNLHGHSMQYGGNLRTFEIAGCGAFQLIDRYYKEWFEEGKEIVSFQDIRDLKEKIEYYLDRPTDRERIAKAGQERAYRYHTYKKRMEKLIPIIMTIS
jgi:spore maturation protein CgeB